MKSKFNILYEQVMNSLICEAYRNYTYYPFNDIALATMKVTNNFNDPYEKGGITKQKVLDTIKDPTFKDYVNKNVNKIKELSEIARNYWTYRQKEDPNNDFANKVKPLMDDWDFQNSDDGKRSMSSYYVGYFVYGLYTAIQNNKNFQAKNEKYANDNNLQEVFKAGSKIDDLKLTVTFSSEMKGDFGYYYVVKGKDSRWPNITFIVDTGCASMKDLNRNSYSLLRDQYNKPDSRETHGYSGNLADWLIPGDIVRFSGEIKEYSIKYNSVKIKKTQLLGVDFWAETEEQKKEKLKLSQVIDGKFCPGEKELISMDKACQMIMLIISNCSKEEKEGKPVNENAIKICEDIAIKQFLKSTGVDDSDESVERFKKECGISETDSILDQLADIRGKMLDIKREFIKEYKNRTGLSIEF